VPAGAILRRSLLFWGLGHLRLGDPRGWVLAALMPVGTIGIVVLALGLIESDQANLVFLALVAFFGLWGAQAIWAYRQAVAVGGQPGGAIAILALAPFAVAAFTGFWLVAGTSATPAATLQRYVTAWRDARPADAASLFQPGRTVDELTLDWRADDAYLRTRILELSASLGPGSGLDPDDPFASLVVDAPGGPGAPPPGELTTAEFAIVRRERIRETLFGIFPTAAQRDVVVERIGRATLRAVPAGSFPLPIASQAWRLESVELGPG
jgi:hypothetical protein